MDSSSPLPPSTSSKQPSPPHRPILDFMAGTAGGMGGVVVGHPFDTIKTRMQAVSTDNKYGSILSAFRSIRNDESLKGLYKGVASPMLGVALVNGIIFSSFKSAMNFLSPPELSGNSEEVALSTYFAAGCFSGVVSSLVNTPVELIKIRQQQIKTVSTPSMLEMCSLVWKEGGLRGLYRGLPSCCVRDLGFGPYFFSYELILRLLNPAPHPRDLLLETTLDLDPPTARGWSSVFIAGSVAGLVSWTSTFPFDLIKTRVQSDLSPTRGGQRSVWRGTWSATKASYREGGMRIFYRGLGPTLARAIPVNCVTFGLYEAVIAAV